MKRCSAIDYCLYFLIKAISSIIRLVPLALSLYLMKGLGYLVFYILPKKRRVAYKNLKIAFPAYSPQKINKIVKQVFMNSAQHLAEIFYMTKIDKVYINKFIEFEGLEQVLAIMENKKGSIFLALHEGSWEVASVVASQVLRKYNYAVLIREQPKIRLLSKLLNEYRLKSILNVITVTDNLRPIVETLKKGSAIGMVVDHGAQDGILVNFFGRPALTPTGALKLALKLDTNIFMSFMKRKKGARHKITLSTYKLVRTGDEDNDLKINLENINRVYEKYITDSPQEYLWFFKRWKHSPQRNILILSDGKTGHLKQSLAVLDLIKSLPFDVKYDVVEIKLKNYLQKLMLQFCGFFFSSKCQGCMWCVRHLFNSQGTEKIILNYYDAVISCGSSLAMLNRLIAFENVAKSIVVMKPGMFSLKRFDLVIVREHDNVPKFKNVVSISGAMPREIDENKEKVNKIIKDYKLDAPLLPHPAIGLLIGGSNKYLYLDRKQVKEVIKSLDGFIQKTGGCVLISTSRRTHEDISQFLKDNLSNKPAYKMLIIANELNPQGAFEAILHLSDILVVSGDSVSMVSEAINSGKHTIVFKLNRKFYFMPSRQEKFIDDLNRKEYVYVSRAENISSTLTYIWKRKPTVNKINDKELISERFKNIL